MSFGVELQLLEDPAHPPASKEIIFCFTTQSAFEILDQRYGDEDELMSLLLHDIKSCPPLKTTGCKSLKTFAGKIREFIVRVKDLKKDSDLRADYLHIDVINKLPWEDIHRYKVYCRDKQIQKSLESLQGG